MYIHCHSKLIRRTKESEWHIFVGDWQSSVWSLAFFKRRTFNYANLLPGPLLRRITHSETHITIPDFLTFFSQKISKLGRQRLNSYYGMRYNYVFAIKFTKLWMYFQALQNRQKNAAVYFFTPSIPNIIRCPTDKVFRNTMNIS